MSRYQEEVSSLFVIVLHLLPPPIKKNCDDGVSVEYAPILQNERKWYVLRVSYGRITIAEEVLSASSLDYYIPYHYTKKLVNGKKKLALEPLLSCFVFVRASDTEVENLIHRSMKMGTVDRPCLSYYYNHFAKTSLGKNPPLTVSSIAMENFIRLTSVHSEHIVTLSHDRHSLKNYEQVLVTDGPFKGVRGCVARILGQQRVAVELRGICVVATAYIPTAFLKVLNDNI